MRCIMIVELVDKIKARPVNTKHLNSIYTMLDKGRRGWGDVVQMLYRYFVFAGRGFTNKMAYGILLAINKHLL